MILIAFAAISLIYSFATRLRCGPDEPAHFIYIRSLAVDHTTPPIAHFETRSEDSAETHEGHQPPLYYALMAIPFAVLNALGASTDTIWRVIRLLGIPIGMLWIYAVYLLSREFFEKESYALAAAAFVALIPTAAYMAGVINNEILIAALFTWALVPMLRYFKTGKLAARSAVLLGVIIGLAILTKAQGMVLAPVFIIESLLLWRRAQLKNAQVALRTALIVLGTAALICGWWFIRCQMLYGTPMPSSLYNPAIKGGMLAAIVCPELGVRVIWLVTCYFGGFFWAPFWIISRFLSWPTYFYLVLAITMVPVIGFILRLWKTQDIDRRSLWFLLSIVGILYLVLVRYTLVVDFESKQQGRLFLPIAAIVGIIFVLGYEKLISRLPNKKIWVAAGLAFMAILNAAVIACTLNYYSII